MAGAESESAKLDAMIPLDTSAVASDVQLKVLRNMSGAQRLKAALELSDLVRSLALGRIRQEFPEISQAELIRKFIQSVVIPDGRLPA